MKKTRLILLTLLLLALSLTALGQEGQTLIQGELDRQGLPFQAEYPDNPVQPGISPMTGLATDAPYLPVMIVLDNAEGAYPHWGVGQADVLLQVPNAGGGATKLMALFTGKGPQMAGGVRSTRTVFVDVAYSFDAAFAFAGSPGDGVKPLASVPQMLRGLGMRKAGLIYDLLGNNRVSERVNWTIGPHNLSVNIEGIQQDLQQKGVTFVPRGFRFGDAAPAAGIPATYMEITHHGIKAETRSNPASYSSFTYDEQQGGYFRTNTSGVYVDRDQPDTPLIFSNVIVLRTPFTSVEGGYVATKKTQGTGAADIFIGGRYIKGGWFRANQDSRVVFVDEQGEEMTLLPGKTFIVWTNEVTRVSYK